MGQKVIKNQLSSLQKLRILSLSDLKQLPTYHDLVNMKAILFSLTLMVSSLFYAEQTMTPEEIVQKQLDTYNTRDINGFMSVMSSEVSLYNLGELQPISQGHAAVKSIYQNLFDKSPELKSVLVNRIVMGNVVIDHEKITGRMGNNAVLELSVIYEVKGDKIHKITVIR